MNKIISLLVFFLIATHAIAQTDTVYKWDPPKDSLSDDKVFLTVEEMPEFPGGENALMEYVQKNLKYPRKAFENNISGTVYVSFVINREGDASNIKILRGIGGGCNEEAIRIIEMMPKWKPGRQNGRTVSVQYNMPVRFTTKK